jgi:peptide/nickel transport system permease protein
VSIAATPLEVRQESLARRVRGSLVVRGALGSWPSRVGLGTVSAILFVALLGFLFAPHSPTELVGLPLQKPSAAHWLGTDALGRDVLSRYLDGGRTLVVVAFVATALAYLAGVSFGMAAGYRRNVFDTLSVGLVDLLLSFPPIVFVLLLVAATGSHLSLVVVAIAATHAPRIFRIVRAVTMELSTQEFIEAAVARGERLRTILRRDVLPNILTPVLADFGLRLTGSVILFSSISYLGLGQPPPTPEWALMISENRSGLLTQPWVVVVPAATIALLTIGVNLVADGIARSTGRYLTNRGV